MATIHNGTTLLPGKLDLLARWLPQQSWYHGTAAPQLSRAGGFRLDDPAGAVGIECLLVTDGAGGAETTYFVPLTYRGQPLVGADDALVGTAEHGVLGARWVYDAAQDPVAVTQLVEFVRGRVQAQHQSRSDTLDPAVGRTWRVAGEPGPQALEILREPRGDSGSALGSIECDWICPDATAARGVVAVVR